MKAYTVHQAKTQLSRLIQEAIEGEDVVIMKRSKPLVRLSVIEKPNRASILGDLKGKMWIADDFKDIPEGFEDYV